MLLASKQQLQINMKTINNHKKIMARHTLRRREQRAENTPQSIHFSGAFWVTRRIHGSETRGWGGGVVRLFKLQQENTDTFFFQL